ncbi:hypothetical protein K470DRAFT_268994 [Piedraia hortae CBS 480.64]|uniref:RING-type domain-containing protein n=1 Tax=Piedraia hortae CBS 480.64 TaxID=1314780 RepID=A0A6A7C4E0_9PEZI|nr:hypothetical protein K470DRAFT_268994 [Piedraia hortae CBS 480.64]
MDLERELTCSICTEILYHPLTLLDCLHTCCGSCLKEWFSFQSTSRNNSPFYTCPSCRSPVRGTKADWRLTGLLENYLKSHPERERSAEEKEELSQVYKPGDEVLPPKFSSRRPHSGVLSESRLREHDQHHRQQVEHQPSLRSILSTSATDTIDPSQVQDIIQSIYAEVAREGIDTDNLTPEQEERLSERIIAKYQQMQMERRAGRESVVAVANERMDSTARRQGLVSHRDVTLPYRDAPSREPPLRGSQVSRQISLHDTQSTRGDSMHGIQLNRGASLHSQLTRETSVRSTSEASPHNRETSQPCTSCHTPVGTHPVHYLCPTCEVLLCLRCYREGIGCKHWFGFGYRADERWLARGTSPSDPPSGPRQSDSPHSRSRSNTHHDTPQGEPPHTLYPRRADTQLGSPICEKCFSGCSDCYWSCGYCLDGAWGYCNSCVKTGKHCGHPLLSLRWSAQGTGGHLGGGRGGITSHGTISHGPPLHAFPSNDPPSRTPSQSQTQPSQIPITLPHLLGTLTPLPVTTDCDICGSTIPGRRLHCYVCNNGDYDLCLACHVDSSSSFTEDVIPPAGVLPPNRARSLSAVGQRMCPQNHHLAVYSSVENVILVLEEGVARRGTLRGGSGGGKRAIALWSSFPSVLPTGERSDELDFPKNAEITEVEILNEDWAVGAFEGRVGLFPRRFVRVLE